MGISEIHGAETVLVVCWGLFNQRSWENLSHPHKYMQTKEGREEKNLLFPASRALSWEQRLDKKEREAFWGPAGTGVQA